MNSKHVIWILVSAAVLGGCVYMFIFSSDRPQSPAQEPLSVEYQKDIKQDTAITNELDTANGQIVWVQDTTES